MNWAGLQSVLLNTWASVPRSVLTLTLGLLVAILAIWLIMHWRYREIIATLRERLKQAQDQISAFEDGFGGMSLAEAARRLKQAEARLASLPPRRLDEVQRRVIGAVACPPPAAPYLKVIHDPTSAEAGRYARDFVETFAAAPGWNVVDEPYPYAPHSLSQGIGVCVSNASRPTPTEQLVLEVLDGAGLGYDILPKSPDGADAEIIVSAR